MAGLTTDGGMAEYMLSDAENTVSLPKSIPFEQGAPLMCAGVSVQSSKICHGYVRVSTKRPQATVWGGIKNANVDPSEPIGILGIGGLGSLGVQFAKALGHRVVAIDDRKEGMTLAQELTLKADLVIDFNDSKAADKIKSWAGKGGLAAIVVCTDDIPAITWSTQTIRPRGVMVNIGLPTKPIEFDSFDVVFAEKTIKGSLVASKSQVEDMLKVVDTFGIQSHITTVTLDEASNLPGMYMSPHLKGRLVMKISS
jgi:D-arabinose 1-dehydrogenase-like Zn-dependent alcohol dehydrogenase